MFKLDSSLRKVVKVIFKRKLFQHLLKMNGKKKSRKSSTGGGDTTRSRSRGNEQVAPTSPLATVDVGDVDSITPIIRRNTATAQAGTQRNASRPNVKEYRSSSRDENHDTTSKHDEGNGDTPPNGDTASQATLNVDATSTQRCELSYSGFSAVCVPFGSRAASPTGTCIAGGTVR